MVEILVCECESIWFIYIECVIGMWMWINMIQLCVMCDWNVNVNQYDSDVWNVWLECECESIWLICVECVIGIWMWINMIHMCEICDWNVNVNQYDSYVYKLQVSKIQIIDPWCLLLIFLVFEVVYYLQLVY